MIDKNYFINNMPSLELFYDNILYRKVHTDLYSLIPVGNKVLAWFLNYNGENICVLVYLNKYNKIIKVEDTILSFDRSLCYGTIIYGTYFTYMDTKFLVCEDIYKYKGEHIQELLYKERFDILYKIFQTELQQKAYTKDFVIFGLPFITNKLHIATNTIKELSYPIHAIACQNLNDINRLGILLNNEPKKLECIFKIKACIDQDIYNLYCKGFKYDEYYNLAYISDYKTSVMMNNIFRNIKENANLDLLEESDNEEEFENIDEDKFVNLKKIVYMKCMYIKKFRKWKPIEEVKFGEKLLSKREIQILESK